LAYSVGCATYRYPLKRHSDYPPSEQEEKKRAYVRNPSTRNQIEPLTFITDFWPVTHEIPLSCVYFKRSISSCLAFISKDPLVVVCQYSRNYQNSTAIVELNAATGEVYIEEIQQTVLGSAGHVLDLKVKKPSENRKSQNRLN